MKYRLKKEEAAVLVVDIQERLCAAMEPRAMDRVLNRSLALVAGARALGLPVVVTEQYPKGLGPTVPQLRAALGEASPIEKLQFSCALDEVLAAFAGRRQILMVGMETHVCVFQTARDLAEKGLVPWLCADAVISRNDRDREVGLELCRAVGAVVSSVEAALFDMVGRAGTSEFKAVSQAVR